MGKKVTVFPNKEPFELWLMLGQWAWEEHQEMEQPRSPGC